MKEKLKKIYIKHLKIKGLYSVETLEKSKSVYFYESNIKRRTIKKLRYLSSNVVVNAYFSENYQERLDELIDLFLKYEIKCPILIRVEKLNNANHIYFELLKELGINFILEENYTEINVDEFIKMDQKLEDMIKHIKCSSLSMYEKYLAVYDIVKNFKPYKECDNDLNQSRELKYILENEYIVCVGFCKLLVELLKRVGISSIDYSVRIKDKDTFYGHKRVLFYINDPKYNIDGYYIADPTWDNDLEKNTYNLHALTFYETTNMCVSEAIHKYDYIFNSFSKDEFNHKMNKLFDKEKQFWGKNLEKHIYFLLSFLFEELNKEFYNELSNVIKNSSDVDTNTLNKYIDMIGDHIVSKTNKEIKPETVLKAVLSYKEQLGILKENETLLSLAKQQADIDKKIFPKMRIENEDECYYINEKNKYQEYVKTLKKEFKKK